MRRVVSNYQLPHTIQAFWSTYDGGLFSSTDEEKNRHLAFMRNMEFVLSETADRNLLHCEKKERENSSSFSVHG